MGLERKGVDIRKSYVHRAIPDLSCGREGIELHGLLNVRVVKSTINETLGVEDGGAVRVLGGFSDLAGIMLAKEVFEPSVAHTVAPLW